MGFYIRAGKKVRGTRGRLVAGPVPTYFVNDVEVTKEEYDQCFPPKGFMAGEEFQIAQGKATWPMKSVALAVHPSQVAEANARNKRHGLATRYNSNGTAIIPTAAEKTKLVNLEGFVDKQKGYS